jgi:hypothetical protein
MAVQIKLKVVTLQENLILYRKWKNLNNTCSIVDVIFIQVLGGPLGCVMYLFLFVTKVKSSSGVDTVYPSRLCIFFL